MRNAGLPFTVTQLLDEATSTSSPCKNTQFYSVEFLMRLSRDKSLLLAPSAANKLRYSTRINAYQIHADVGSKVIRASKQEDQMVC